MKVLGLKLTHDATVALIEDGRLVFSVEMEKVDERPRYANCKSWSEVDLVLEREAVDLDTVDQIVVDGWRHGRLRVGEENLVVAPYHESDEQWGDLMRPCPTSVRLQGRARDAVSVTHVASHVAGAYAMAPRNTTDEPVYVLVWDGGTVPRLYHVSPRGVNFLTALHPYHGMVYGIPGYYWGPYRGTPIEAPGLGSREWPGKLMAYIALGRVRDALMEQLDQIASQQAAVLGSAWWVGFDRQRGTLEHALCRGLQLPEDATDADVLATIHAWLTKITINELRQWVPEGARLIYTGGCALNIKLNSALRLHYPKIFVPPCANDTGCAMGAACAWLGLDASPLMWSVYAGPRLVDEVGADNGHPATHTDVARLLAKGEVVAYLEGRSEIGPRALGARSLLAHPGSPETKDKLNRLKGRELWRPVAPMILEQEEGLWFSPGRSEDYYMLFDREVTQRTRREAPAVLHLDSTARVQVVREGPALAVLEEFFRLTGIPLLCNTSANLPGRGFFSSARRAIDWARGCGVWVYADGQLYAPDGLAAGTILVDLDGCLCDPRHRLHLSPHHRLNEPASWDEFHAGCPEDQPHEEECAVVRRWGGAVVYVTSRTETFRQETLAWLARHNLPCDALFMRAADDHRPSAVVKGEVVDLIDMPIAWAMDDDDAIVAMYRSRGIRCLQPRAKVC